MVPSVRLGWSSLVFASNERAARLIASAGIVLVLVGIVGVTFATDATWIRIFDKFHWLASHLSAAVLALIGWLSAGEHDQRARGWFAVGLGAGAIATLLHAVQSSLGVASFPLPTDLLFLLLGPCSLIGILCAMHDHAHPGQRWPMWLDTLAGALVAAGVAFAVYMPIAGDFTAFQLLVMVGLPMFTLSAASGGLSLIIHLRPRISASLLLYLGTLLVIGLAWVEWNYRAKTGELVDGGWLNILLSVCALTLGLGAMNWRLEQSNSASYRMLAAAAVDFMPMAAILLAILVVPIALANDDMAAVARQVAVFSASCVAIVSVLRQSLLLLRLRGSLKPAEEARITAAAANPFGSRLVRIGSWAHDVASGQETWSAEAREIFGVDDATPATFENLMACLEPADRPRVVATFNAAISGWKSSFSAEFRLCHQAMGVRQVLARGWIERDSSGRAQRVYGLALDVTDLRSMESDLVESRERLEMALSGSGAGIWEWSAPLGDASSDGFDPKKGVDLDSLGEAFQEIHPDDLHVAKSAMESLLGGITTQYDAEFRVRSTTGLWRWILCRGRVTGWDDKGRINHVSGVKLDITERRQIEEALRASRAAVAETAQRYHRFFNNMRNIIVYLGTKGEGADNFGYDETGVMLLGRDVDEIDGTRVPGSRQGDVASWYQSIHPDDLPAYLEAERRRREEGLPFEVTFRVTHPKTGEKRWLREIAWTTKDPAGAAVHMDGYIVDLTREKAIEVELQESQARYQEAERVAQLFHWVSEPDPIEGFNSRRVTFSPTAAMTLGIEPNDLNLTASEFFDRVIHPDDRDHVLAAIDRAIANCEASITVEYRIVRPDGSVAHILANNRYQYDQAGKPILGFGTMQDVTERKQTERALRESAELYRQAEMAARLVHWSSRAQGGVESEIGVPEFSDAAELLFGIPARDMKLSHDEFIGQMIHNADRERIMKEVEHYETIGQEEYTLEYRIVRPDGGERDVLEVVKDIHDETGRWVSSFGTMLDVTESKRTARELEESKARYEAAERIAGLSHWVCVPDPDPRIDNPRVAFSRTAALILGVPEADLAMTARGYLDHVVHPDDRERVWQELRSAIEEEGRELDVEYRILRSDGSVRFIQEHCRYEFGPDGRMTRGYGTIQDITERKLVEEALRTAHTVAETANRAKTQFLANTSHELRTPLNAIIGFSEIMAKEIFGSIGVPIYRQYSQDILASGQHLLGIINDLLDLSRIEAGETKLNEQTIAVEELVLGCISLLHGRARERQIELSSEMASPLPKLRGDLRLLKQVLINLLSNAVKFTPVGGSVRIRVLVTEGGIDISVEDTGIGMSAEELAEIAKPFVQIESWLVRKHEGVGLGLAISKSLVELHGGTLIIESEKGRGTTVTAKLPVDRIVWPTDACAKKVRREA